MEQRETICAIATATGGALAVIRISGPDAIVIADTIFAPIHKNKRLLDQKTQTLHFGSIMDGGTIIDEVLLSIFRAPRSYSGENMAEISCHASAFIQSEIMRLLIAAGARMARPGEFTQRAFLNGKMDLSQAEAVADIIAAGSAAQHRLAISQLRGGFADELRDIRGQLLHFVSMIELELDFGEEEVEFADRTALNSLCGQIETKLDRLVRSFAAGNAIKNGIPVAIVGQPNAGKSTLLNALLNEERAIVSEIAGTTRDTIEDHITIGGVMFRFIDTAGIRHTEDVIENMGIARTFEKIAQAEIVILMADGADAIADIARSAADIRGRMTDSQRLILLINKMDKLSHEAAQLLSQRPNFAALHEQDSLLPFSARTRANLHLLEDELARAAQLSLIGGNDAIVTNARHHEALSQALNAARLVSDGLHTGLPSDLVALEIRQVLHFIGEVTGGTISNDEILGNIFKNFCIGK